MPMHQLLLAAKESWPAQGTGIRGDGGRTVQLEDGGRGHVACCRQRHAHRRVQGGAHAGLQHGGAQSARSFARLLPGRQVVARGAAARGWSRACWTAWTIPAQAQPAGATLHCAGKHLPMLSACMLDILDDIAHVQPAGVMSSCAVLGGGGGGGAFCINGTGAHSWMFFKWAQPCYQGHLAGLSWGRSACQAVGAPALQGQPAWALVTLTWQRCTGAGWLPAWS